MHFNIPVKRVKGGCFCTGHPNTKKKYIEYSRSSRERLPWNFEKVVVTRAGRLRE